MPRHRSSTASILVWVALFALPGVISAVSPPVERQLVAMGTELGVVVEAADRRAALAASERAIRAIEAVEARLSTWHDDSELARLNQAAPGERIELSAATVRALRQAARCWAATGGAFDPTVGALSRAWGLRQGGRLPEPAELRAARAVTGMDGVEMSGHVATRRRAGVVLDEGGFGKGAGLAAALIVAADARVERITLDLGGQVAVWSKAPTRFRLTVADPRDRRRPAVAVEIDGGSLATSGNSERFIVAGGKRFGHLLDPRSGRPVPDFGSLTVWSRDPLEADCLSSGLYVMGPDAALAWAAARSGVEVLVLEPTADGARARATAGWLDLQILSEEIELETEDGDDLPSKSTRRRPLEPVATDRDRP